MLSSLFQNKYLRKLSTVLSGALLSQLIPVLASPLLSRTYSPFAFGYHATFIAICTILATFFSLSFDSALLVAESDDDIWGLLYIICILSCLTSALLFILIAIFKQSIAIMFSFNTHVFVLYLIPVYVFQTIIYLSLNNVYIRFGAFRQVTQIKVSMSLMVTLCNIGGMLLSDNESGLIVSQVIGYVLLLLIQIPVVFSLIAKSSSSQRWNMTSIKQLFLKYVQFPKYHMPGNIVNTLSLQLPPILINSILGANIAGYYNMTNRVLALPTAAISNALADVFKNDAFTEQVEYGHFKYAYNRTLKFLLASGVPFFIAIFFFSPVFFELVFGDQWALSGYMSQYMVLMYALKYVAVPLGFSLIVVKEFKLNLRIQILLLLGIAMIYLVFRNTSGMWQALITALTALFSVFYAIIIVLSYRLARRNLGH